MADPVNLKAFYELGGKVALITGGTECMGREIRRFLMAMIEVSKMFFGQQDPGEQN